jgi:hypothetical protein
MGIAIKALEMQPKALEPSNYERLIGVRTVVEGDNSDDEDWAAERISGRRRETVHEWQAQRRVWRPQMRKSPH